MADTTPDNDKQQQPEPGPAPPRLTLADLRSIVADQDELGKGARIFDGQGLSHLSRHKNKIFCEAAGSGASPYKVSVAFGPKGEAPPRGRCGCPAARTRPYCKHSAALLVAWARAPESFAVSESGPADAGDKKKAVKTGKTSDAEIMRRGVEQVGTLIRELAVAGVAAVGGDRARQVRELGEGLRQSKLRRLSARAIELSALLELAAGQSGAFSASDYTDLVADMLLTTRKLEKHLAGEPLDERHVEELVGKTWGAKDRQPADTLMLVEYAFSAQATADDFYIRESRFFDLGSGRHYSEKQILPGFLVKRTEAKKSYQGLVLIGAAGGVFPGFPPLRLKLEDPGTTELVSHQALETLVSRSLPSASAALAAFQEQRKDVFAPDRLPVAVRAEALLAEGQRLRLLDEEGHALALPWARDPALELRFSGALRGVRLRALLGELDVDDAVPTLFPLAVVVEGPLGLELRPLIAAPPEPHRRSRRAPPPGSGAQRSSAWVEAARAQGASPAALALAEVREELAQAFSMGLSSLGPRLAGPLCARLTDLSLGKQAALLQAVAERQQVEDRVDDFIKLYQVLDIALTRLCGATRVDRDGLTRVPTYESVHVRTSGEVLSPREIITRRASGALGRYEAALHYARHYEGLSADELVSRIFPAWADGSAVPYVVRALSGRGAEAVAAARKALLGKGQMAKATAVHVLQAVGGIEAEALLKNVAEGEYQGPRSFARGGHAYWYWEQAGTVAPLRVLAQQALDALLMKKGRGGPEVAEVEARRRQRTALLGGPLGKLLSDPQKGERVEAVHALAKLGDLSAAPALRLAAAGDAAVEVRAEAVLALGLIGDGEMVEYLVHLLARRDEEPELARAAAHALGYLGDARGIHGLLAAFADGWQPALIAEALRAVGAVVLEPLLDFLLGRPDFINDNKAAMKALQKTFPPEELGELLKERLSESQRRMSPPEWAEHARLLLKLAGASAKTQKQVAQRLVELTRGAEAEDWQALNRQADQALREEPKRTPGKTRTPPT